MAHRDFPVAAIISTFTLILLLMFLSLSGAAAEDNTMVWDNDVVLNSDYVIASGERLAIEPGVTIRFNGYYGLSVEGTLIANGTPSEPVVFSSNLTTPTPGDWVGIRFKHVSDSTQSILSNVLVEYAVTGIQCDRSCPSIENSHIRHSLRKGIDVYQASPSISNNTISGTTGIGIKVFKSSSNITGNIISSNINGIDVAESDSKISSNTISDNAVGLLLNSSSPSITNNSIVRNHEGIIAQYKSAPSITDNNIADNDKSGIWCYGSSSVFASRNNLQNNWVGIEVNQSSLIAQNIRISGGIEGLSAENGANVLIYNSSISDSQSKDIIANLGSVVIAANVSFGLNDTSAYDSSTITMKNYVRFRVLGIDGLPLASAKIRIEIYSEGTHVLESDITGYTEDILLVYRVYSSSQEPQRNSIIARISYGDSIFDNNPRDIDMSTSHVEIFDMTGHSTPNGLNPALILFPISFFIIIFILYLNKKKFQP